MVDTTSSRFARWRTMPLRDVQITSGFWHERRQTNRDVSLTHGFRMLLDAGNLHNLRLAANSADGGYRGPVLMASSRL